MERSLAPEPDDVSESEESISSSRSCRNERSLQEKLEIISGEGLLPTVKVFLDWLRTNTDLIIMCAQMPWLRKKKRYPPVFKLSCCFPPSLLTEFPEFMESTFSPPKPASFSRRPARFSPWFASAASQASRPFHHHQAASCSTTGGHLHQHSAVRAGWPCSRPRRVRM
ncbi:putative To mCG8836 isoform 1 protein, partial [Naja naja]